MRDNDEGYEACFQVKATREGVLSLWETDVHTVPGWQPEDAADGIALLMLDIADRNKWSREEFLRLVTGEFESRLLHD